MTIDYERQAIKWHRDEPKHNSDFCGRPEVFELAKVLSKGKEVLDAGCGEGYFSRKLADIAKSVTGVDLSEEMIRIAIEKETQEKKGIQYHVGDVRNMYFLDNSSFDLCVGNYITNYLKPEELQQFYQELARVSKENGQFVLLMPHPVLELITDYGDARNYQVEEYDYIGSRGKLFKATLGTIQGDTFEAGLFHSTLEDHLNTISSAGLRINRIIEPIFPQEIAEKYPIFNKMGGKVTGMIIVGEKI